MNKYLLPRIYIYLYVWRVHRCSTPERRRDLSYTLFTPLKRTIGEKVLLSVGGHTRREFVSIIIEHY